MIKNMNLIGSLREKDASRVRIIENLLEETKKGEDREKTKYALLMAIRLYDELIKQRGSHINKIYPDIQKKIDEATNEFLDYNT